MIFRVVENFSKWSKDDKEKSKGDEKGGTHRSSLKNQMGGALRARYRPMSTLKFLKSMSR